MLPPPLWLFVEFHGKSDWNVWQPTLTLRAPTTMGWGSTPGEVAEHGGRAAGGDGG